MNIRVMSIATGHRGTRETLRVMAGLIREAQSSPVFQNFVRQLPTLSTEAVDYVLRPLYTYTDEDVETLYAPQYNVAYLDQFGTLIGDCDDITMMYGAVFFAMGLPIRLVAMQTKPTNPEYLHVVIEVFEHRRWKRYDATVPPNTVHRYFGELMQEYV